MFNSSLGDGQNVVLFNIDDAVQKSGHIFQVNKVQFSYKEINSPYYLEPDYEDVE